MLTRRIHKKHRRPVGWYVHASHRRTLLRSIWTEKDQYVLWQSRSEESRKRLTRPDLSVTCVLIAAAIPCGLAGLIQNYAGLLLIRFFVGIAGASFVPCLTWCTLFYDKVCDGAIAWWSGPVLTAIGRQPFRESWAPPMVSLPVSPFCLFALIDAKLTFS